MSEVSLRFYFAIVFAALAPTVVHAQAKIQYSAYEGEAVIKTGTGGTKLTKNGIDYWTSGEPPRRFQVIGLITDKRDEVWDGGHAVGSPSVAGKVKKAGGDAVIVESQDEGGNSGGGGNLFGKFGFFAMGGSKTMTRMVVVKYLPVESTPATPSP
jgi:hypothetical protein